MNNSAFISKALQSYEYLCSHTNIQAKNNIIFCLFLIYVNQRLDMQHILAVKQIAGRCFYCSEKSTCTAFCPTACKVLLSICSITSLTVCHVGPKLLCWQSG